jgi:hypothetical protein
VARSSLSVTSSFLSLIDIGLMFGFLTTFVSSLSLISSFAFSGSRTNSSLLAQTKGRGVDFYISISRSISIFYVFANLYFSLHLVINLHSPSVKYIPRAIETGKPTITTIIVKLISIIREDFRIKATGTPSGKHDVSVSQFVSMYAPAQTFPDSE